MSTRPSHSGAPDRRRRFTSWPSLLLQTCIVALAAVAYFGVRALTQSNYDIAAGNAERLVTVQRALAIDIEHAVQEAIIDHDRLVTFANWVYIYGHWPLIIVTLTLLYLRVPQQFRLLRNAMFASGAIGLVIFAFYPVAPPRLGILDMVDTVSDRSTSYRTLQPPGLVNPYAALPSLHFGWNLLVGIILWRSSRNVGVRIFAVTMPALMAFAVVATANHYIVDVFAGGLVALAGLAVARALPRDPVRTLRRHLG